MTAATDFVRAFARFGGRRTLPAALLVLVGSVVEGLGLALLVPLLTFLVPPSGRPHSAAGRWLDNVSEVVGAERVLPLALLLFCVVIAVRASVLIARDGHVGVLSLGFADSQRARVVSALAHARWETLAALRHAEVAHVLSGEVASVAYAAQLLPQIGVAVMMVAVQLAVLVLVSPPLAALSLALAAVGMIVLRRTARAAADSGAMGARAGFRIAEEVAALLGGLKFAAAHDLRRELTDRAVAEGAEMTAHRLRHRRRHTRGSVAASSAAAFAGVVLVGVGIRVGVSTVALLAGLAIILRMSGPLRVLQSSVPQFAALMPAYASVVALCARLERSTEPPRTDVSDVPAGRIELRGVCVAHPGASCPALAGVDLTIAPGETLGLAGASGAGKTTLLDLLAGLREPDAGSVTVGNFALDAAWLPGWRRRLAYLTQDTFLIDDNVRRNLSWGGDADEAAMTDALDAVGLCALVADLPDGLDTRVAERGSRFSGGQRQRLALARAILRRPALVLLDEATSALDLDAEAAVLAGVRRTLPDAAIVLVSHRLEALVICDRVVTLADGRIASA